MELRFMNDAADKMLADVDQFKIVLIECLKDKDFDLETRWSLYLKCEKLLPIDKYLSNSIYKLTEDVYENFFGDGRGMLYNSDIDERLVEDYQYYTSEEAESDKWALEAREMFANRDAWREAVLEEGYSGFVFDW